VEGKSKMEKKGKVRETLKGIVGNIWYVIAVVAICTLIVFMIAHWDRTILYFEKLFGVLMQFIIGFFFSYLINPLVRFFNRQLNRIEEGKLLRVKKGISVTISYLIVVGLLTIIILYISPQIQESGKELAKSLQSGYNYLSNNKEDLNRKIPFINLGDGLDYIKTNLIDNLVNNGSTIVPYIYEFSSSVVSVVYNTIIGIVISIYIILDSDHLVGGIKKIVYAVTPVGKENDAWKTILKCNHIFNGFLFGKAIDSLIIGILCLITMSILRLPYALLLSMIVGITNMIPYFGPFIGAIPGVLIYLFINPKLSLVFAILILVLQQFDGLYLGPKILGDLTGIKPLWVIFGVTFGGAYFGVMGMFLGVPAVAVLMYLINLFIEKKIKNKGLDLPDA
jgi:predicted PurR-regulated permease PerM